MTFILIHGSWHNGMVWHKVETRLRQLGRLVYAPTLQGFESRQAPPGKDIGLSTHIQQIVELIARQEIGQAILVGHSYAGLVISGVAEAVPERVRQLVYLDAFIPADNQSLFDLLGPETEANMRASLVDAAGRTRADGAIDVWLWPPSDPGAYGVSDPTDVAWLQERLVATPVRTFEERVRVKSAAAQALPHAFIRCTEFAFLEPYERQARSLGWPVFRIRAGHDAMITVPDDLTAILVQIAEA